MALHSQSLYEPLLSGWIRLAVLQPGSPSDNISIRLEPARLLPEPGRYFEALSYVWGPPDQREKVVVNGVTISATRSLISALKRLRIKERERTLWVDAICINQEDLAERRHQVELMATIYKLADKVLIYLGPSETKTDENAMDIIADVYQPLTTEIASRVSNTILSRSWFERVWVVQEAALAKVAIVILGKKAVRWDCFTAWPMRVAPFRIERAMPGILSLPPRFQPVEGTFLQRLHETRSLRSTDPRDKVFGLLGLIPDRDPWLELVDYNLGPGQVYTRVAKCFVENEKSLRFLSAVHHIPGLGLGSGHLLSWVPDWSFNPDIIALGIGRDWHEPYNAGGYPAIAKVVQSRLIATGVLLDIIEKVGSPSHGDRSPEPRSLQLVRDRAEAFKANRGDFFAMFNKTGARFRKLVNAAPPPPPVTGCEDARIAFRAVTTAAPPTTLQQSEEINCRSWKSKTNLKDLQSLDAPLDPVCFRRRIFETKSGLLGLGPEDIRPKDSIVVLLGGPVPYVLRKEWKNTFIGECYVLGAMGGEALKHLHDELQALGHYLGPCGQSICDGKLESFEIC